MGWISCDQPPARNLKSTSPALYKRSYPSLTLSSVNSGIRVTTQPQKPYETHFMRVDSITSLNMHELFLNATVGNTDFEQATAVLQGLCAMAAWQSRHQVLYYAGPPQGKAFTNMRAAQPSPHKKYWPELSQQLSRQSYILQARYEVFKDKDFGTAEGGKR